MASKQPVWGIDVGQCSLKAVKAQAAGEQIELLGFDIVEHETILSQSDADAGAIISKSIQTFAGRNDLKGTKIAISVPGQQTLTRFTKMPPVERKKLPDMVQYEASQQIPFDMDEVVWDYQVFEDKDSPDVEVGIFAIRRELIRTYVSYFTEHGVEPSIVQTSPMASYNAAKFEGVQGEGQSVVLLDMGALATDLIVMEGNRIWSRPVPIGGNRFTEALISAFKISFAKAEKLKRTAATSKYARQVFAAMRPIFADLVSEVQRSVGYYTSTHREAQITRIIGMGNAFKLPGLQKFLQQNLQLQVDRLTGFVRLLPGPVESSPAFAENISSLSVPYGLAIQMLDLAAVTSTLLPIEIRKTLLWRKKRPWFGAAAACLALGAATMWVGNLSAGSELRRALGDSNNPPRPVANVEEAERVLSSPAADAPVGERAQRVVAAANKLKQAFDELDRKKAGDQELLKRLANLTENNVILPRMIDLVHRTLAAVALPELRDVRTTTDYLQVVKQMPREQRREVWIDKLDLYYNPKDPALTFKETTPEKATAITKPGWAMRIVGTITDPKPATWIEETLLPTITKLGREPGRGIYVDQVAISKVTPKKSDTRTERISTPSDSGTVIVPRDGGRGGLRDNEGREESAYSGGERGGRALFGAPGGDEGGATSTAEEINSLRRRFMEIDPVTGESIANDQRFTLYVIIRKGDTPAAMIPDEYKPKKPEGEKGKPAGGS